MELERGPVLLPALGPFVVDAGRPARELRLEVVEVVEVASIEEADS
jgi:hypothetical protein